MRLALDPRARRLLRRVPRNTVYSALELILLSLLAMQCARLVWTIATPVDPIGAWKTSSALRPALPAASGLLGSFDPFFRLSGGGNAPLVVTSLDLKLFGVREDRASGRGSAIISTPDGQQRSFAIGEEIVPGVTLVAVGFDSATINRGGTAEQLFLDQSSAATVVAPEPGPPGPSLFPPPRTAPPPPPPPVSTGSIASEIQFQPRVSGGRLSGVVVQPQGSGNAFRAAGLQPGDVIVAIDGQRITSPDQARALAGRIGSDVSVQIDRSGQPVELRVRPGQ